jgi:chorismate mutase-like protein
LHQLRQEIDRLDAQILARLNRRGALALLVGRLKRRQGRRPFDPAREQAILKRLSALNGGPLPSEAVRAIYREILRQSRRLDTGRRGTGG